MAIKNMHKANKNNSELLLFGVNCIANLIPRVKPERLSLKLIDKIFQLFMHVENPKVRSQLAQGLQRALTGSSLLGEECLAQICQLNKVKRGLADLELDCDKAIAAIQFISEQKILEKCACHELNLITYSIIFLCQHEEYSVREYASHFIDHILKLCK